MSPHSPPAATGRDYDRLDAFLDRVSEDVYPEPPSPGHDEISRQTWGRLTAATPLPVGARVLDVGCGQGVGLNRFRAAGLTAVGVTLSEEDHSVCERAGHDVRRMDQSFLDFTPGEFALVWCRHCLEHSIAPYFTLTEFRRVLEPGGLLYLEVPAPDTACRHEWNPNHYSVLGRNAWLALLSKAGFTVLDAFDIGHDTASGRDVYFGFICRSAAIAPAPDPERTRLQAVSLGFEAHGATLRLDLELDRDSRRERPILEALEAGRFHEQEVAYFITNVLQPGDLMVDVGAGVGYFAGLAGCVVGLSGAVRAFEPEVVSYRRLERHVALNRLNQVEAVHAAVGAVAGSAVPRRPGSQWSETRGDPGAVVVVSIDSALAGLATGCGPRMIRIDTGGSELEVLKGTLRTILAHEVPFIICAVDRAALKCRGASEMQLRGFMRLIGYQAALLKPDASGLEPLAEDQAVAGGNAFSLLFLRG